MSSPLDERRTPDPGNRIGGAILAVVLILFMILVVV